MTDVGHKGTHSFKEATINLPSKASPLSRSRKAALPLQLYHGGQRGTMLAVPYCLG